MRLSEAILLGSVGRKLIAYARHNDDGGCCALGMAEWATGLKGAGDGLEEEFSDVLHGVAMSVAPCGCTEYRQKRIASYDGCDVVFGDYTFPINDVSCVIAHISNEHIVGDGTWTIDRLAQWVDSIDPTPRDSPESVENSQEVKHENVTA